MIKKPVFYSFHYGNDVHRVQLIRNIGALDGNTPANPNEWERIRQRGDGAIKNWIDENMKYKRCVIVLIGAETADRPWVRYEIAKAWNEKKALFGIYIHNVRSMRVGVSRKGSNPFSEVRLDNGNGAPLSNFITCYEPNRINAYGEIAGNIGNWIEVAIAQRDAR